MATIKAIEARSVHQIQSGQVIVDLCSVVKELVENSLDAGATSVDIRFKNNGLDLIEVQDNGGGITPENYETIALKHYTSKLSTFDDLTSLQTFGFRGEALSSLCALSNFHIVTAQANQAPKATRLEFETSGKLKKSQVVAGQKGTTASVGSLFQKLPVRRRELEKNIKREYGKVLGLLHAYACISTRVRFNVKNQTTKDRNAVVFSTNSNPTTKENIANVYGAKTLLALIPLSLELEFQPSTTGRRLTTEDPEELNKILVHGHISRPIFGEGRQTPDRQMFFVNSRPCGLPQIAKAFNEVYRSFNVSQSPFIFADFQMNTNAYDVNVSPDKRTILLHDSGALIQSLKTSLTELFDEQDQTVPQSEVSKTQSSIKPHAKGDISAKTPSKSLDISTTREPVDNAPESVSENDDEEMHDDGDQARRKVFDLVQKNKYSDENAEATERGPPEVNRIQSFQNPKGTVGDTSETVDANLTSLPHRDSVNRSSKVNHSQPSEEETESTELGVGQDAGDTANSRVNTPQSKPNVIQNAFDRMRPTRPPAEMATITIGDRTITSMVGTGIPAKRSADSLGTGASSSRPKRRVHTPSEKHRFGQTLRGFAAPGTQTQDRESAESEDEEQLAESGESDESGDDEADHPGPQSESDIGSQRSELEEPIQEDRPGPETSAMEIEDGSNDSDDSYVDEKEKQTRDEAKVKQLIQEAEEKAALPSEHNTARANKIAKGSGKRDSTAQLVGTIDGSLSRIEVHLKTWRRNVQSLSQSHSEPQNDHRVDTLQEPAETRLSLTVSKDDFAKMRIVGQFNLGFILATRSHNNKANSKKDEDELFIIDQHASDEKYNFERLQAETVVQNQRLVQPKVLDLTAVEEEVIIDNLPTLERNGFIVEVDMSGDEPIGRRCKLVSLPLSKEVVFNIRDLEELIVLLSESPQIDISSSRQTGSDAHIPRPSKVRKMFAMRACRSSIMVGKTLTFGQMEKVVRHMGMIDKPWNCPHGRPTMRHLMSLGQWSEWDENDWTGNAESEDEDCEEGEDDGLDVWRQYLGEEEDIEEE